MTGFFATEPSGLYSLHILEVERLWVASDWCEAAMLHHIGDGRYRSDGELLDENRRMTRWRHLASLGIR